MNEVTQKVDTMNISQAEFARRVGTSRQYINRLVREGKLTREDDGSLDEDKVTAEFQSLSDVGRDGTREWAERQRNGESSSQGRSLSMEEDGENVRAQRLFNSAKAREKSYVSLMKELEYKAALGEYVKVSDVEIEADRVFSELNSILNSLPSRLAPKLMQRESLAEIQQILEEGLNEAKQTFQEFDIVDSD